MAIYDKSHCGYRVFIGDLGGTVGRDDLQRELDFFGVILDIWVARNPPGFAFAVFKYPQDAEKAVEQLHARRSRESEKSRHRRRSRDRRDRSRSKRSRSSSGRRSGSRHRSRRSSREETRDKRNGSEKPVSPTNKTESAEKPMDATAIIELNSPKPENGQRTRKRGGSDEGEVLMRV